MKKEETSVPLKWWTLQTLVLLYPTSVYNWMCLAWHWSTQHKQELEETADGTIFLSNDTKASRFSTLLLGMIKSEFILRIPVANIRGKIRTNYLQLSQDRIDIERSRHAVLDGSRREWSVKVSKDSQMVVTKTNRFERLSVQKAAKMSKKATLRHFFTCHPSFHSYYKWAVTFLQ